MSWCRMIHESLDLGWALNGIAVKSFLPC
jgi:hypothetical protein